MSVFIFLQIISLTYIKGENAGAVDLSKNKFLLATKFYIRDPTMISISFSSADETLMTSRC